MKEYRRKKYLKKIGALLCASVVFAAVVPARAGAIETAVAAEEQGENARALARIQISVGDGQETPLFRAGEKAKFELSVKNGGNMDARNVQITPVIQKESEWPFEMEKMNYAQSLGTIGAGGQTTAVWGTEDDLLTVRKDVTGKAYKLIFDISYDDGEKEYTIQKYVFVKTAAKDGASEGETPKDEPGNGGNNQAGSPGTGSSGDGTDTGSFYNGDPVISGGGASETGNGSVPRVIVTGFDTQPGEVRAGSDFKLIIHLKNTSSRTAVSNMLFDLQAPSSGTEAAAEAPAFLPSSGSSSIYLENIPAGGSSDISIDLNARADLVQKPYSISMSMKYEDSSATQYEAQSSLAIPVIQEARFEFSEIQIAPDPVSAGEEANITCNLYNLGRVKMYNVKARFEGDMIESQEQFIGNLDAGASGTVDSIVTAVKETAGEEECRLVLSYEDDAGKVSTSEQKFMMNVMPESIPEDMGMLSEDVSESSHPFLWLIPGGIVAAAAVTAAVLLTRRRRKKLREAEEEELFDEVERSSGNEH